MMVLRPASLSEVDTLVRVGRDTFTQAFGHFYAPEDLEAFLAEWRSRERMGNAIERDDVDLTVAEEDGAILGYCTIFFGEGFEERPEPQPKRPALLSQLYCLGGETGRGIGAALMDNALTVARQQGCDAVQLSVFSENFGAQRFYARYGFVKVADIDFWVGDHRDDEFLYELKL